MRLRQKAIPPQVNEIPPQKSSILLPASQFSLARETSGVSSDLVMAWTTDTDGVFG